MKKLKSDFVIRQYQSGVESYAEFTTSVGLWASEKFVFEKYLKPSDVILDLGCGTGRTTFPLFELGYKNIIGVDLTPEMIEKAKELNQHYQKDIRFEVGDATKMNFPAASFDVVIFSFNGFMSIPDHKNRQQALLEIKRVLKENGLFIFTTHDRNAEAGFLDFWKEEKQHWEAGKQNPALYDFGDLITHSKNESREIFIHIPDQEEIIQLMNSANFELLESFYRSDRFEETEAVKKKSGECRFWIVVNK